MYTKPGIDGVVIRILMPIGRVLGALRISPNVLSLSGVLVGVVSGYLFAHQVVAWAIVFFVMNALADAFDGIVAHLRRRATPFGEFFDNFCGGYGDAAVFGGMIVGGLCDPLWGVAALAGMWMRMVTFRLPARMTAVVGDPPLMRFPYKAGGKGDRVAIMATAAVIGQLAAGVVVVAVVTNAVAVLRTVRFRCVKELTRPTS